MSDAPKLLPCPFCGKEAKIYQSSDCCTHEMMTVSCSECFAQVNFDQEAESAIVAWNTRTPDQRVAALVEAANALRSDMMERAQCKIDTISGEQYRVVNAGNGAWTGFCAALEAMGER